MHTGILSGRGGEFSAKEKLRDVAVDGGEFNIICQNAFSSSAISLKYEKTLSILLLYTSQVKLLFLRSEPSQTSSLLKCITFLYFG